VVGDHGRALAAPPEQRGLACVWAWVCVCVCGADVWARGVRASRCSGGNCTATAGHPVWCTTPQQPCVCLGHMAHAKAACAPSQSALPACCWPLGCMLGPAALRAAASYDSACGWAARATARSKTGAAARAWHVALRAVLLSWTWGGGGMQAATHARSEAPAPCARAALGHDSRAPTCCVWVRTCAAPAPATNGHSNCPGGFLALSIVCTRCWDTRGVSLRYPQRCGQPRYRAASPSMYY
jgi:hypothetical protein